MLASVFGSSEKPCGIRPLGRQSAPLGTLQKLMSGTSLVLLSLVLLSLVLLVEGKANSRTCRVSGGDSLRESQLPNARAEIDIQCELGN